MTWVLHLLPVLAMHFILSLYVISSLVPHPVMCPLLYPCINPHPAPIPTPHPCINPTTALWSQVIAMLFHACPVSFCFHIVLSHESPCLPACFSATASFPFYLVSTTLRKARSALQTKAPYPGLAGIDVGVFQGSRFRAIFNVCLILCFY